MSQIIHMRYGASGSSGGTGNGMVCVKLGAATADGSLSLDDSISNYNELMFACYQSDIYRTYPRIPVSFFKSADKPIAFHVNTANSTNRSIRVAYADDMTITVSNRTNLNIEVWGIR